jgi:beta-lactam-binding protein with PASTA domain
MTLMLNTPTPAVGGAPAGGGPTLTFGPGAASAGIPVPDVLGDLQDDAVKTLTSFGFTTTTVQVTGDGQTGTVYGQDPPPDTIAPRGGTIRLFVISAPPVDEGARFDAVDTALADLKKDVAAIDTTVAANETAAETRHDKVMAKLEAMSETADHNEQAAAGRHYTVMEKLADIANAVGMAGKSVS